MWKQKREPWCCNSSWLLASGRRNTFERFDYTWCSRKKWEQLLFSSGSDSPSPHFGGTIHMDCGVSAWLDRMWISTSSDGHWRSGNGSAAISYAIHHRVRRCAHAVSFAQMFACCWYSASVWTHVRSPLQFWQSNENCQTNTPWPLRSPEWVHYVIINHQQQKKAETCYYLPAVAMRSATDVAL